MKEITRDQCKESIECIIEENKVYIEDGFDTFKNVVTCDITRFIDDTFTLRKKNAIDDSRL